MHSGQTVITICLFSKQLYFSGESLRNVAKSLKLLGMDVSHQTACNRIEKHTKLMNQYLDKIVPQVGGAWRADEIYVKIRGELKHVFAMMDDETDSGLRRKQEIEKKD